MHAILIWFDHLPYAVPGCCGNTEAHTPGFDRFAAHSVTFDNCFATDLRTGSAAALVAALRTLRDHGAQVSVAGGPPTHLLALLQQQAKRAFDIERLDDDDQLTARAIRAAEAPPDDREPQHVVTLVSLPGVVSAAGEVIDERLETADRLLERLALVPTGEQTLLLVAAGEGVPPTDQQDPLNAQRIHVPLLGRSGPPLEFGLRSPSLVAVRDVPAALLCRAGVPAVSTAEEETSHAEALLRELQGERVSSRSSLRLQGADDWVGLRTRQWSLRTRLPAEQVPDAAQQAAESAALYVQPDDPWERLDVASQSPAVVEELVSLLAGAGEKSGAAPGKHR